MKNHKLQPAAKTIQIASLATILAVTSGTYSLPSFAAGVKDHVRVESKAELDAKLGKDALAQGKLKISETAERLSMKVEDVADFFREQLNSGRADMISWSQLLNNIKPKKNASRADLESADISVDSIRNYMEIRRSRSADNIEIREADLAQIQSKWSSEQRANFAKVLRKTNELLKSGKFSNSQEAFEAALKAEGRYSKFRSCKI